MIWPNPAGTLSLSWSRPPSWARWQAATPTRYPKQQKTTTNTYLKASCHRCRTNCKGQRFQYGGGVMHVRPLPHLCHHLLLVAVTVGARSSTDVASNVTAGQLLSPPAAAAAVGDDGAAGGTADSAVVQAHCAGGGHLPGRDGRTQGGGCDRRRPSRRRQFTR